MDPARDLTPRLLFYCVTPAKAGVFVLYGWKIPAFAGMTLKGKRI
jgi:hypothetical protein